MSDLQKKFEEDQANRKAIAIAAFKNGTYDESKHARLSRGEQALLYVYLMKDINGKTYGMGVDDGKYTACETAAHGECISGKSRAFHMFTDAKGAAKIGITHCCVCKKAL